MSAQTHPATPQHAESELVEGPTACDVIVLTHNRPLPMLQRAIRSGLGVLEHCGGAGGRVIVVDNASSPPVRADDIKVVSPPDAETKVVLIRNEPPKGLEGPSHGRNAGLDSSRAPWVVLLDDDDELIPEGVFAAMRCAEKHQAVGALVARVNLLPDGTQVQKPAPAEWADGPLPSPAEVFRPIALFGASGLIVSRRAIDHGVRFDPALAIGEDRDFIHALAMLGPVVVSSAPALRVTIHASAGNLSGASHMARRIRDHVTILDRYPDAACQAHLREATRWLVNAAARSRVDEQSWSRLLAACAARGWPIGLKPRFRRVLHPARAVM